MTSAIVWYDLRRSLSVILLCLVGAIGCVLLLHGPLSAGTVNWVSPVGVLTGILLSVRLLSDTSGTQAFVFSRGVPRRRLFLLRLLSGVGLIGVMWLCQWLLIWLGLRGRVHQTLMMSDVFYYPMSTSFESAAAWPFVVAGLHSFCIMSFYMVWRGLCAPGLTGSSSGVIRLFLVELPVLLMCLYMMAMASAEVVTVYFDGSYTETDSDASQRHWRELFFEWLPMLISGAAITGAIVGSKHLEAE